MLNYHHHMNNLKQCMLNDIKPQTAEEYWLKNNTEALQAMPSEVSEVLFENADDRANEPKAFDSKDMIEDDSINGSLTTMQHMAAYKTESLPRVPKGLKKENKRSKKKINLINITNNLMFFYCFFSLDYQCINNYF